MSSCVERLALKSPTLPPATTTNCLLLGDTEMAIVDPASPWAPEQDRLVQRLKGLADEGRSAACIVLTHHHHDHVGGVQALREAMNLPVLAHPRTAELLSGSLVVDDTLEEGDVLETGQQVWQVLHTPGHATGHICLFHEATGEGIVGDMLAGEGTIVLDPPEGNLEDYIASLERLMGLNARRLYPAHGPALEDPQGILAHYIQHRHARTRQVADAGRAMEHFRPEDLVPKIYAEIPKTFWPIAARQVLCHLQYLVKQGDMVEEGGVFSPNRGGGNG